MSASERETLIAQVLEIEQLSDEWLRRQIVEFERIDLLMTRLLGWKCEWHHRAMLRHQLRNRRRSLALIWRGAGKTTARTVAYAVLSILQNPDVRILIASRSGDNAKDMCNQIKDVFEKNQEFRRVFGDWIGDNWSETSFTVKQRVRSQKEPTVDTVGVEGSVVSRHYDIILADDLVDEEVSRTVRTRDNLLTFYYKSLVPCLEPDGQLHMCGTRYHPKDLYGHLMKSEFAGDAACVIPALGGNGQDGWFSHWPEKFTTDFLVNLRSPDQMGLMLFNTQYQCDCSLMQGSIFDYDKLTLIDAGQVPDLPAFIGVDLAIALNNKGDYFAICRVAYDRALDVVYVLKTWRTKGLPVHSQKRKVIEEYDDAEAEKVALESNFYQAALGQEISRERPDIRVLSFDNKIDKTTNAWGLSARIDAGKLVLVKGLESLVEEMVLFPNGEHDDLLDALHAAIRAATGKARRPRIEPTLDWSVPT